MTAQSYLRWSFGLLLSGVLLLGAVNAVVDPYGIFGLVRLPGFNLEKARRLAHGGRIAKSVDLRRGEYDTLILGSSRAQSGIDPMSPLLTGPLTYNAGLAGPSMREMYQAGRYALAHQELKQVIFGVDFVSFSSRLRPSGDFDNSGFAGHSLSYIYLRELVSARSLADSAYTVLVNSLGKRASSRLNGYLDGSVKHGRKDPRYLFTRVLENGYFIRPSSYAGFDYSPGHVAMFRDLVESFAREGIAVHVFFSPMHARQLEAIRVAGLFPVFERWKRDVVAAVEQVNHGMVEGQRPVPLWDFSGYNSITTEAVPLAGAGKRMKWYWESSHYKKEVGELVLQRMLRPDAAVISVPSDFGVWLNSENLEAHLEASRWAARRYRASNVFEVTDIEELFRKTEPIRRQLN